MKSKEKKKEHKHRHIWKYKGVFERICEAPFPTIEGCGEEQIQDDYGNWIKLI